jgi:hypothetical protein
MDKTLRFGDVIENFSNLFEETGTSRKCEWRIVCKDADPAEIPVVKEVLKLHRKAQGLEILCIEILDTLILQANAKHFAEFPASWHDTVASWRRQLRGLVEANND